MPSAPVLCTESKLLSQPTVAKQMFSLHIDMAVTDKCCFTVVQAPDNAWHWQPSVHCCASAQTLLQFCECHCMLV